MTFLGRDARGILHEYSISELEGEDPAQSVVGITAAAGQDSDADADLFFVAAPDGSKIVRVRADGDAMFSLAAHPGAAPQGPAIRIIGEQSDAENYFLAEDGNATIVSMGRGGIEIYGNRASRDALYVEPIIALNAGVNIANFQPESGSNYVQVTRGAYLKISATAAPADAELSANEAIFWFDSSNGAAKLMVKAKQANGTVVTGSVNLA